MFHILESGKDIFEKNKYVCQKNHIFLAHANDKLYCNQCFLESILTQLNQLNIPAKINGDVIEFEKKSGEGKNLFNIGKEKYLLDKKDCVKIIIKDDVKNIKDKLWDAIIAGKDTIIEKQKIFKHHCEHTTIIKEGNDGTGSLYKSAPPPYPFGKKLAVGYIRVSTTMQVNEGVSLEAQESEIFRHAELNNYFLKTIYIDRGITGGEITKRLGMQKLIENIENEEGLVVITYSISRIARNVKDLLEITDKIEKNNGNFVSLEFKVDFTTSSGKFILTILGSQAELERNMTSERVKSALSLLKSQGKLRSKPRYGWDLNVDKNSDDLYVRNEEEQEIIRKIRNLRYKNKHLNITRFTKLVNDKIPPPRKAKTWYRKNLQEMMIREGIWENKKTKEKETKEEENVNQEEILQENVNFQENVNQEIQNIPQLNSLAIQ